MKKKKIQTLIKLLLILGIISSIAMIVSVPLGLTALLVSFILIQEKLKSNKKLIDLTRLFNVFIILNGLIVLVLIVLTLSDIYYLYNKLNLNQVVSIF